MRKSKKIVATALSAAMAASMCVAVPATAAFAEDGGGVIADGTEAAIPFDEAAMNSQPDQFYTGEARTPYSGTWNAKGTFGKLTEGVDYTVIYKNNVEIGTATATITGIGKYSGTITKTFKIIEFTFDVLYNGETLNSLSKAQINKLTKESTDNDVDLYYQYGGKGGSYVCYVPAKSYVTVASIMKAEGITSWNGVKVTATDHFGTTVTAATDKEAKFFPGQTKESNDITDGAVAAPAVVADSYSEAALSTTAAEAGAAAKSAYESSKVTSASRIFVGASEEDYKANNIPGSRYVSGVCYFDIQGDYTALKANTLKVGKAKVTVKKGKKATVKVKKAKGAVTVASSAKKIAEATYSKKTGKVTIKALKKGKATITVTAAGNNTYKAGSKTIKVTVK